MKIIPFLSTIVLAALCALQPTTARAAEKVRLLIVSGGHGFDTNEFFQLFKDNPEVTVVAATHPAAHKLLRPESAANFDVLVLYDMWQKIDDEGKADFVNFLKSGKGMIALHHSIANYQDWPEYAKIVGGRYYLRPTLVDGVEKARSIWKHDVEVPVRIADAKHPVTSGLKDFVIHDETYGLFDMLPGSHALLTTEEPNSAKNIAWVKTYGDARVMYLQLGHDKKAYANPNFRQLVAQAIRWAAKKEN
jgi:type 1 glutamine amidotransferase